MECSSIIQVVGHGLTINFTAGRSEELLLVREVGIKLLLCLAIITALLVFELYAFKVGKEDSIVWVDIRVVVCVDAETPAGFLALLLGVLCRPAARILADVTLLCKCGASRVAG